MKNAKADCRGEPCVRPLNNTITSPQSNEHGVVLIALLWIFIALSAIVLSFARESRVEVTATRNNQSMEKAYYTARAGISEAIYRLVHQRYSSRTQSPGLQQEPTLLELGRIEGEFGNGRFSVEIQDESGKVNLNMVSEEQLRALVLASGIPLEEADIITDSIMDWRDQDDAHRINGAEEEYYQTLDPPYAPKNGVIDAIEEILLIRGITPEYFYGRPEKTDDGSIIYKYGLSRYLTVYSNMNQNQINVNFAPLPVLLSIPGMPPEAAERIFEKRLTSPFQNAREISDEIPGTLGAETLRYLTTQMTGTYSLRATGYEVNSKIRRVIHAVFILDGSQPNFHRILYWNESVPYYQGATL